MDLTPAAAVPQDSENAESGHTIKPVDFSAPTGQAESKQKNLTPIRGVLIGMFCLLGIVAWFMFTAKSVRLDFNAAPDEIVVDGSWLSFQLGERYLLRAGMYRVSAVREGYVPFESEITVTGTQNQQFSFALEKLPGLLTVKTSPVDGATILVDGHEVGTTPMEPVELKPGPHRLVVKAERFLEHEAEIVIEGALVEQELEVELEPGWANVGLKSDPLDAEVFVDGESVGRTPMTAEILQGFRRVSIGLDGYKSWEKEFEVLAGEEIVLPPVTLESADGLVALKTQPPGAAVTVSGQYRGRTPVSLELDPGKTYNIVMSKAGYSSASRQVRVRSQSTARLDIVLEALLGHIEVSSNPQGVKLLIDGREQAAASGTFELSAIPHVLEFKKDGYAPYSTTVTPRPGFPQVVAASLKTLEQIRDEAIPKSIATKAGYELKLIKPGRLVMGSPRREQGRQANESQRNVELTKAFYLGTKEVTNKQFRAFDKAHKSGFEKRISLDIDNRPAVRVSWEDAALFCNWLSKQEDLSPAYGLKDGTLEAAIPLTDGYRLPTEAEWAWAARYAGGSSAMKYPWGESMPPAPSSGNYADKSAVVMVRDAMETYEDTFPATAPVGSFTPNRLGIFDLGGNVSEWVHDYYSVPTGVSLEPEKDPAGPDSGEARVIRGSSWMHGSIGQLRLTYRQAGNDGKPDVGFRVARYLVEPPEPAVAAK